MTITLKRGIMFTVAVLVAVLLIAASCSGQSGRHRGLHGPTNPRNKHVTCTWVIANSIGSVPHRICSFVNPSGHSA